MYFDDEPREDYPGDYLPEENTEEKQNIDILEGIIEDRQEDETSETAQLAETEAEAGKSGMDEQIEVSDELDMREIPEEIEKSIEDDPEVMVRSPVLAETNSEPGTGKSRFFSEIANFDEIKIGKLDGNSGNLTTFLRYLRLLMNYHICGKLIDFKRD